MGETLRPLCAECGSGKVSKWAWHQWWREFAIMAGGAALIFLMVPSTRWAMAIFVLALLAAYLLPRLFARPQTFFVCNECRWWGSI